MKKSKIILITLSALLLTSCNSKSTQNLEAENNSELQNNPTESYYDTSVTFSNDIDIIDDTDSISQANHETQTDTANIENIPKNYKINSLVFPSGNDELTEYNADILNIEPFTVNITLPEKWQINLDKPDGTAFAYSLGFSTYYIYDENNICIGTAGYNVIPDLADEDMMPTAIYSQIDLGNDYRFDIREKYDIVTSTENFEAAITDVYYSNAFNNGNCEITNRGIVAYDLSKGVYAAFEFDAEALSKEECVKAAESISISDRITAAATALYGRVVYGNKRYISNRITAAATAP